MTKASIMTELDTVYTDLDVHTTPLYEHTRQLLAMQAIVRDAELAVATQPATIIAENADDPKRLGGQRGGS